MAMENKVSWKALEYKRKDKTADWYWAVIIISLSIVIISFMVHNVLFAILIIIATGILLSFSINPPKTVEITMNQKGITVGKDRYPFASLESFWVENLDADNQKILFRSKKILMPLIIIPLEEYNHLDIREYLLQYLKEEEMHEPLAQRIMEKLGF